MGITRRDLAMGRLPCEHCRGVGKVLEGSVTRCSRCEGRGWALSDEDA